MQKVREPLDRFEKDELVSKISDARVRGAEIRDGIPDVLKMHKRRMQEESRWVLDIAIVDAMLAGVSAHAAMRGAGITQWGRGKQRIAEAFKNVTRMKGAAYFDGFDVEKVMGDGSAEA
jgi:hypothetical protein